MKKLKHAADQQKKIEKEHVAVCNNSQKAFASLEQSMARAAASIPLPAGVVNEVQQLKLALDAMMAMPYDDGTAFTMIKKEAARIQKESAKINVNIKRIRLCTDTPPERNLKCQNINPAHVPGIVLTFDISFRGCICTQPQDREIDVAHVATWGTQHTMALDVMTNILSRVLHS